eukprot:RCo008583
MAAPPSSWSSTYSEAREKFRQATTPSAAYTTALALRGAPAADGTRSPLKGTEGESLTIDIAAYGNIRDPSRLLVYSSGVHGLEGYAGSAIQLELCTKVLPKLSLSPSDCVLFVHALNPFGMSWNRRWNESNVDLNRNALVLPGASKEEVVAEYRKRGTQAVYKAVYSLMNPTAIGPLDVITFYLHMLWKVLQCGFKTIFKAVLGQDTYPEGLFYGGLELEQSYVLYHQWFQEFTSGWKAVQRVVGVDLHTGLGPYGWDYLVNDTFTEDLAQTYGIPHLAVQWPGGPSKFAYTAQGSMRGFLEKMVLQRWPAATVRRITQEFGTYHHARMLRAVRAENCEWHHRSGGRRAGTVARIRERFCPAAPKWRSAVMARGVEVFEQSVRLLAMQN